MEPTFAQSATGTAKAPNSGPATRISEWLHPRGVAAALLSTAAGGLIAILSVAFIDPGAWPRLRPTVVDTAELTRVRRLSSAPVSIDSLSVTTYEGAGLVLHFGASSRGAAIDCAADGADSLDDPVIIPLFVSSARLHFGGAVAGPNARRCAGTQVIQYRVARGSWLTMLSVPVTLGAAPVTHLMGELSIRARSDDGNPVSVGVPVDASGDGMQLHLSMMATGRRNLPPSLVGPDATSNVVELFRFPHDAQQARLDAEARLSPSGRVLDLGGVLDERVPAPWRRPLQMLSAVLLLFSGAAAVGWFIQGVPKRDDRSRSVLPPPSFAVAEGIPSAALFGAEVVAVNPKPEHRTWFDFDRFAVPLTLFIGVLALSILFSGTVNAQTQKKKRPPRVLITNVRLRVIPQADSTPTAVTQLLLDFVTLAEGAENDSVDIGFQILRSAAVPGQAQVTPARGGGRELPGDLLPDGPRVRVKVKATRADLGGMLPQLTAPPGRLDSTPLPESIRQAAQRARRTQIRVPISGAVDQYRWKRIGTLHLFPLDSMKLHLPLVIDQPMVVSEIAVLRPGSYSVTPSNDLGVGVRVLEAETNDDSVPNTSPVMVPKNRHWTVDAPMRHTILHRAVMLAGPFVVSLALAIFAGFMMNGDEAIKALVGLIGLTASPFAFRAIVRTANPGLPDLFAGRGWTLFDVGILVDFVLFLIVAVCVWQYGRRASASSAAP